MVYADSMMQTPAGDTMYSQFMADPQTEDTSALSEENYAYQATMNYFMEEYYRFNPLSKPDSVSLCFNADFSLNDTSDNFLYGYQMYDGFRLKVTDYANFQPILELPENQVPTSQYIQSQLDNDFRFLFNLNPYNNVPIDNILLPLPTTGDKKIIRNNANYTTFELFQDGYDLRLPLGILRRNPPSGRQALKINNEEVWFHADRLSKRIYFKPEDSIFYYSFATVMENPADHTPAYQPFFIARLSNDNGVVLEQKSFIADTSDAFFDYYQKSSGGNPIVYNDWHCERFDLRPYLDSNSVFSVDFIAADCGQGLHYGYAYVSFCEACSEVPSMRLDSLAGCLPDKEVICGTFDLDTSLFEVLGINIEVHSSNSNVSIDSIPLNQIDFASNKFCGDISSILTTLIKDSLCADIYAVAILINQQGDTITVRSKSIIPNTITIMYNDICYTDDFCCTSDTITMGAAWQYCLLGQGYENAHLVSSGTINSNQIPSGYSICGFKPGDFEGATIDYISSSTYGGNFEYEIGIMVTDWTKLRANAGNYYFLGYWKLCRGADTCEVPVKLMILSSQTMCSWSYGLMCNNFKFIPTPITIYSDGKGNSCVGVHTYFPFDHNPGGMKEDSCTITSYNVTFKLLRNNAVPYTLLTTTVYPDQNPGIKKFATALCWPTSWNSNVTGWQMEFTNNCGGSCTMVQNKPAAFGGDTGSSIFNHNMTESIDKLMVSPNPASSLVNASWNINSTPERMAIIDYSGKVIYSERILDQSGEKELNVGNLKAGNYHLTIFYTDGRSISTAFMIGK